MSYNVLMTRETALERKEKHTPLWDPRTILCVTLATQPTPRSSVDFQSYELGCIMQLQLCICEVIFRTYL